MPTIKQEAVERVQRRWSYITDYTVVPWWKVDNLLMSFDQLIDAGLLGGSGQLRIWIHGRLRKR